MTHVPPSMRARYFRPSGDYHIPHEDLRQRVRFHRHDLVADAPVVGIDLIACRNTLMYLNSDTQRRILAGFHRSLNDGGILFLGRAETLLPHDSAFRPIDLKRRISAKVSCS
jgi:two-component system, chemotaxis family, CheB/CheR fusion protein